MRIRNGLLSALFLCCLLGAAGCGEETESYAGTWAVEEFGWINGGEVMEVSVDDGTMTVSYTAVQPAPDGGSQRFTGAVPLSEMEDGYVSLNFVGEDDPNCTGTMNLQFSGDRVYREIKNLNSTDAAPLLENGTVTLARMEDAFERLEYTEEEYDAWYAETFPDKGKAEKSSQEIVEAMKETEDFTWNWFYDNIYTDKGDTVLAEYLGGSEWTYERVIYPGISSLQDVRDLTKQYYTADVAEQVISYKCWLEANGSLYVSATEGIGGGGPNIVEVAIQQTSSTCYTITLYEYLEGELLWDPYDIHYQYIDGYWVFDSLLVPGATIRVI